MKRRWKNAGMTSAAVLLAALSAPVTAQTRSDDASIPLGRLPDTAAPTAYRLDFTVDPSKAGFSGHAEIDVTVARPTRSLYLHGLGLSVRKALANLGGRALAARYAEVDASGVARLDFDSDLPAGRVTLSFDYTAPFMTSSEGLYRAEVGKDWYAWTQMQPTDARRVFPSFDEPGFKVPFTVSVTAPTGQRVFANTPEVSGKTAGTAMTRHVFAASKPLPTYLIAFAVGPFDSIDGSVAPNAVRQAPLPYRVIATKGQRELLRLAAAEGPKILALHEDYFGIPYPYEKLDQIATPLFPGGMENPGLVAYNDTLLLLGRDAPLSQRRDFGDTMAHELAHQWFGDLVTPVWWNDIWLNESFASWAGDRVGELWQPGLGTDVAQLSGALSAMATDSLGHGRPIRQQIDRTVQISSVFDGITYQKGGQMLTMVESYLGPDKFRAGVHLHLTRFAHKNATAEDFFRSMAEGSGEPGIVSVFQSFVTQTGVPVVTIRREGDGWLLAQTRYRPLGVAAQSREQLWSIPVCARSPAVDAKPVCTLLTTREGRLAVPGGNAIPNANGAGYYRYSMDDTGWAALLTGASAFSAREAMVAGDSLWADFAAGNAKFARVLDGARVLARHPQRTAAIQLAKPLSDLMDAGVSPAARQGYRRLIAELYQPKLRELGFNPKRGAYAGEDSARTLWRQSAVSLMANQAFDPMLRGQLRAAADAVLAGDAAALDPSYRQLAFIVGVTDGGMPFIERLLAALVTSHDPLFRQQATAALGTVRTPEAVARALIIAEDARLQSLERTLVAFGLAKSPAGRDALFALLGRDFGGFVKLVPPFLRNRIPSLFQGYCTTERANAVEQLFRPNLAALGTGELELEQTLEAIRRCTALHDAKGPEIDSALAVG